MASLKLVGGGGKSLVKAYREGPEWSWLFYSVAPTEFENGL